jgi:hypothetical protein
VAPADPLRLVLLAAGASTRYGRPKQLDPLGPGGAALPAYTVLDALAAGFGEVVVVTSSHLHAPLAGHLARVAGPDLPLAWVHQHVDPGRDRPWGTGHAVLEAGSAVAGGPFGVANADDWYGPEALRALAAFLRDRTQHASARPAAPGGAASSARSPARGGRASGGRSARANGSAPEGCLVTYPLAVTLSPHGGVSRARVRHRDGLVTAVEEITEVEAGSGAATEPAITGLDASGHRVRLDARAQVSMNLWGLPAEAPTLLRPTFDAFLRATDPPTDPSTEFRLSDALGELVAAGALTLRLLPAGRRWFGVTHPGDRAHVRACLAELHDEGAYPPSPAYLLRHPSRG